MPQKPKGRTVSRTLRTTPETAALLSELAAARACSVDDLVEVLAVKASRGAQSLQVVVELRPADFREAIDRRLRDMLSDLAAAMRADPGEGWDDAVRQIEAFATAPRSRA